MFDTLTEAPLDVLAVLTSPTENATPLSKLTRACSITVAVSSVVWRVSGSVTVVCAPADAENSTMTPRARIEALVYTEREV
jgi:hypothetical protein